MTKMVGIYFYFGLQISDWQSRRRTRKDCWYFVDAGTMNYFLYCGQDCLAERNSHQHIETYPKPEMKIYWIFACSSTPCRAIWCSSDIPVSAPLLAFSG